MSPSRSKTVLKSIVRGDLDASGQRHWRIKRKIESEVSNCVARASIECVSTQARLIVDIHRDIAQDSGRPKAVLAVTEFTA
jgi:hypothetical protein